MATTEHTINDALAEVLRQTRRAWRSADIVRSENTGMIKGSNERPDILVVEPNVSPVVIETEVMPATTVEPEAISRLGKQLRTTGRAILSSIAVRLPLRFRKLQGSALQDELTKATDLEMALYTGSDSSTYSRWPRSGWIQGSAADLSILTQSASVPPDVIDEAANQLVSGISEVAGMLGEMAVAHSGAIHRISEELFQVDGEQTRRMAATILANAFIFHENLAGGAGQLAKVNSVEQLRGASKGFTKSTILAEWRKILKVNYWPIFDIARRILEVIPAAESKPLIESLADTADRLLQNQLMRSHDLTGAVFQRLIADRKFLAAYYTTPASAALLVGLAITPDSPPNGGAWSSADNMKNLRLADFACGTGTLLSTAYQRVSQLHELAGGDMETLHPQMMSSALVGCDVLPAAAHLTASMLAGAHPTVKFNQSSIMTVAYGKQPDGIALGSLDLLNPQGKFEILSITAKSAEGMGEAEREVWRSLPHASFDVVIMNPPFTRPTGHEGKKIGVHNPMFAAFSISEEDQRLMGDATKKLTAGTNAGGNAGEASIFLLLADRKLKQDGTLALVMPLSLMSGDAWKHSRALLYKNYSNLVLVSIAGADGADLSFSADTGMGECLVVGRKSKTGSKRATFVVLKERPAYPLLGASAAKQIQLLIVGNNLSRLEDGPVGGTTLNFGSEVIGQALSAPLPASGGWNLSRIADLSLAQTSYQLANEKRIWLPTMNESDAIALPISTIGEVGKIGPLHLDIQYDARSAGGIRGPFDISTVKPNSVPTYPVLWSHDAERERTILFDADSEGTPHRAATSQDQATVKLKVASVWATASHCHFNQNFQFNSQSTGMQFTPRKTIGGRAWLSIQLSSVDQEKALVLWANTTLGLLLHWWHANKQQSGRGNVGKAALQTLPILDITALSTKQLAEAVKIFNAISGQPLLPLHEIDKDPVRKQLDENFARDVLGLAAPILTAGGPLEIIRMKMSHEPSIRGGK